VVVPCADPVPVPASTGTGATIDAQSATTAIESTAIRATWIMVTTDPPPVSGTPDFDRSTRRR
jgi:hypothetical protein